MKIPEFVVAGSPSSCHRDSIFARTADVQNGPEAAGFRTAQDIVQGRCSLPSTQGFEEDKPVRHFARSSGMIEFTPIQTTLRNVMALRKQSLTTGTEHQGDGNLGRIEAETHATGLFNEDTTDGR